MARKFTASHEKLRPDPRFGSKLVSKFINCLMYDGKKTVAQQVFYDAAELIEKRLPNEPTIDVFNRAVENVKPAIEVRSKRVGGATYQVPVEIRGDRRMSLGVRWLVQSARKRNGKSMSEKLSGELVDAMNGLGAAVKRREDTHKMADANKAFSHFKW